TLRSKFNVKNVNWINGLPQNSQIKVGVKVRYRSPILPGMIRINNDNQVEVSLKEPYFDITPGQAAVFYQKNWCLGGGLIAEDDFIRS
ncbi:MAG: aminomethyltransferase beta-barrel domain-containing protein, partial [Anaerolineales bacterium]